MRPRHPSDWAELPGTAGRRYTASEVAQGLGVPRGVVTDWIARGLLRAARQPDGVWRIRHRAVRRALRDHPQVAATAMRAWERLQSLRRPPAAAPSAPDEPQSSTAAHEPDAEQAAGPGTEHGLTSHQPPATAAADPVRAPDPGPAATGDDGREREQERTSRAPQ